MKREEIYKRFQEITEDMFSEKHWDEATKIIDDMVDHIESLEQQNQGLQARIKELEEPKTCDGCKHENMEEGDGLYHVYCGNCLRIHVDEFEPKDTQ